MKASKKNLINQAAIELFARHSIYGATVKDITSKAGVTEGALYRHYKSKEEMAARLYVEKIEALMNVLTGVTPCTPFSRQLCQVIEALYKYYDDEPYSLVFLIRNFHIIQTIDEQDLREYLYNFISQYVINLCSEVNPDIEWALLPSSISGLVLQPVIFHYYKKLPLPPLSYAETITANCCQILGINYEN